MLYTEYPMLYTECFTHTPQCWPKYQMDHTQYRRYEGLKSVFMTDKLWYPHARHQALHPMLYTTCFTMNALH